LRFSLLFGAPLQRLLGLVEPFFLLFAGVFERCGDITPEILEAGVKFFAKFARHGGLFGD
jgi:hypothetical protein